MKAFKEDGYYEHCQSKDLLIHVVNIVNRENDTYTLDILYIRNSTLAIQAIGSQEVLDRVTITPEDFTNVTYKVKLRNSYKAVKRAGRNRIDQAIIFLANIHIY